MIIDLQFFSYGAGLVAGGWVFGMIVSSVFNVVSAIKP